MRDRGSRVPVVLPPLPPSDIVSDSILTEGVRMDPTKRERAVLHDLRGLQRRDFLKAAALAVTAGAVRPEMLLAAEPRLQDDPEFLRALSQQAQEEPPPVPLGNGEHPALVYQAYPGGTGSLYRSWYRRGIDPFERHEIAIRPWEGAVPGDPDEIAWLPVERLAALIQGCLLYTSDAADE